MTGSISQQQRKQREDNRDADGCWLLEKMSATIGMLSEKSREWMIRITQKTQCKRLHEPSFLTYNPKLQALCTAHGTCLDTLKGGKLFV